MVDRRDFSSVFLPSFQQGFATGSRAAGQTAQQAQRADEFEKQFQAQQAAEDFRRALALNKEARTQQEFGEGFKQLQSKGRVQRQQEQEFLAGAGARKEMRDFELRGARQKIRAGELDIMGKKMGLATQDLNQEIKKEQLKSLKVRRRAAAAAVKERRKMAKQLNYQIPKMSRAELAQDPEAAFQRIDQSVAQWEAKTGRKFPAAEYSKLRADAAKVTNLAQIEATVEERFNEIAGMTGFDEKGLKLMLGSVPVFGRMFPELRKNAQAFEQMEGFLTQLSTTLQQSEPNSQKRQEMAQQLTTISKLDTENQMKAKARFVIDVLRTRRKEAGTYLQGQGILEADVLPTERRRLKASGSGPLNFRLPGAQ